MSGEFSRKVGEVVGKPTNAFLDQPALREVLAEIAGRPIDRTSGTCRTICTAA
jgi:hypothetical protein